MKGWPACESRASTTRVPALFDLDTGLLHETRPAPVEPARVLGQRCQCIECGQRAADGADRLKVRQQRVDQRLEELALACQRPFAGGERFVFERLQFGGDEALGVLHRLLAPVVGRHLGRLRLRHLDEVAAEPVELHSQVGDAAALALLRFEREQKGVAAGADRAQLVEVGVLAGRDDAAVAQQRGRLFGDGVEQPRDVGGRLQRLAEHVEQHAHGAALGSGNARRDVGERVGRHVGKTIVTKPAGADQGPMHDEVGVAADRRGEMGVAPQVQTKVAVVCGGVFRLRLRAQHDVVDDLLVLGAPDLRQDGIETARGHDLAFGELDPDCGQELTEVVQLLEAWFGVGAIDERLAALLQQFGRRDIGEDHELLDEPMRVEPSGHHHAIDGAIGLQDDLAFRQVEVERLALFARDLERGIGPRRAGAAPIPAGLRFLLPVPRPSPPAPAGRTASRPSAW